MVGGRCKMINIMEGVRALQLRGHLVYRGGVEGGAVCQASRAPKGIEPLVEGVLERGRELAT